MSDVEVMFLQVHIPLEDCNALRFLWWPDGDMEPEPEQLMMTVHLFGGISSPSCANFALRKTMEDNREEFQPEMVRTVECNFYLDNCLKSVETVPEASRLVRELSQLLQKGGFHLTKWLLNSPLVVESVPESKQASSVKSLDFDLNLVERALGVRWSVTSDTFGFDIVVKPKPPTRGGILSVVSSVYDPLGFVSPFILTVKILQDLREKKLS